MNNNQKNQPTHQKKQVKRLNSYARFTGVGFQMLVTIGLGVFIGYKLDERYPNEYQLYTIIFSLLFIGIALYSVIRQVTKFSNQTSKNDKRDD